MYTSPDVASAKKKQAGSVLSDLVVLFVVIILFAFLREGRCMEQDILWQRLGSGEHW